MTQIAMADDAPSPHGLAALAISVSLVEVLLKQGVIDPTTVEAALKEANLYAQALCIDCSPEVERETQRLLKQVRIPAEPEPVAEPSTAAAADAR
jgi:hypothetical protein